MATDTNPRMHAGNGLEGISIGPSEIALVDGENGRLIYRGHDAEVLVRENSFEEVAYLLWTGRLPNEAERNELKVVSDQVGAPTGAELIADATALALHRIAVDPEVAARTCGVFHLAASGSTSWHGYAQLLIQSALGAGMPLRTTPDRVLPIPSADYPAPAARPANSRLDTSRVCATFGLTLPPWQAGVIRLVSELAAQAQWKETETS